MTKQYIIPELPEKFRSNTYSPDIPAGVYLDPTTNTLVILLTESGVPLNWDLGTLELEEAPEYVASAEDPGKLIQLGDRSIDTRAVSGYPIEDIVKIIEASRT